MKTLTLRQVQKLVHDSAKLLDSEVNDWHKIVKVEKLSMQDAKLCIVGQLKSAGRYAGAYDMDSNRGFWLSDHKFTIASPGKLDKWNCETDIVKETQDNGKVLNRLWTFQIAKRLRCDERKAIDKMYRC